MAVDGYRWAIALRSEELATTAMEGLSLAPFVPRGLALALECWSLRRLGHRRGAWTADGALGALTVTLPTGLLAITVCAGAVGLPVWIACWWLGLRL